MNLHRHPLPVALLLGLFCLAHIAVHAQGYTSFFTGDTTDAQATPAGGVCMMGGATEHDEAMRWFLRRSGGGDILVLRASGADGYNAYLYSQLGITVNSVETIRFDNATAAGDPYVQRRIREAEAIWFAGGDQWDYVSYWRGTAIDSLLNDGIQQRRIVVGGTSAGMAILGRYYFSAANGTITSASAMANPYAPAVTVDGTPFLVVPYLQDVITDTHYDNPDRRGRHLTFLARILTDFGQSMRGIACEEYTAVCIDTTGIASVYGNAPTDDDKAYFIQVNCEVPNNMPEVCVAGQPLQWDQGGYAVKAYAIPGTPTGANTWDLNDWATGTGGSWEDWSVYNNLLFVNPGSALQCGPVAVAAQQADAFQAYPQPCTDGQLHISLPDALGGELQLLNAWGQVSYQSRVAAGISTVDAQVAALPSGMYWLTWRTAHGTHARAVLIAHP